MFRTASRTVARAAASSSRAPLTKTTVTRRWASTVPADKSRSWKSSAVRWGLAGTIVYYYNTTNVFADDGGNQYANYPPTASSEPEILPTLDSYSKKPKPSATSSSDLATATPELIPQGDAGLAPSGDASDLEAEASQQGAFNEETGEINWDCPCLGGMAHGPCGEEFKAAFSCFVFSKEEPKGVDCIDKFKGMQDCFRLHPDVYGAELEDDEEGASAEGEALSEGALAKDAGTQLREDAGSDTERAAAANAEVKANHVETSESKDLVPKAWHDDTAANTTPDGKKSEA